MGSSQMFYRLTGADGGRAALKSLLAWVIETVCLWQGYCSDGSPAHSIHHTALMGAAGPLRADWHPCSGLADLMGCVCAQPPAHNPYQLINSREGVVRVVQGIDQLMHPIVGLTASVETNAHRSTTSKTPEQRLGVRYPEENALVSLCAHRCAQVHQEARRRCWAPSSAAFCDSPSGQSVALSLEFTEMTMAASELSLVPITSTEFADV